MPFICLRRTDIQNSTLQVTDFWPNRSQANASIDPQPQGPRYVSNVAAPSLVTLASTGGTQRYFPAATGGLSAYLLANVQVGAVGPALTPAQALTASNNLVTRMRSGLPLALANIDAVLAAVIATASLTGNASTGAVTDVLRILAGATYTVPAATIVQDAAAVFVAQATPAAWNANNFDFNTYKDILSTDSSFYISVAEGQLDGFSSANFLYRGTTGAAVVIYTDVGSVL